MRGSGCRPLGVYYVDGCDVAKLPLHATAAWAGACQEIFGPTTNIGSRRVVLSATISYSILRQERRQGKLVYGLLFLTNGK